MEMDLHGWLREKDRMEDQGKKETASALTSTLSCKQGSMQKVLSLPANYGNFRTLVIPGLSLALLKAKKGLTKIG